MKKLNLFGLLAPNVYWVGLSFMWNSLHPILLPAVLLNFVPDAQKNTYLGLLTFAGLVIAMIVQPLSGAVSDRWVSRWGRRRPLILAGTLVDFLFLALLGWAGGLIWLAVGYIGLQFSSNTAHGPLQGLLPDVVPQEQLGTASGIKTITDMLGLVVASLLAGHLLDPQGLHPGPVIAVVIGTLLISSAITLIFTREKATLREQRAEKRIALADLLKVDFRAHTSYWWLIATRFAFLMGIYGIQAFAQYYLRDVLKVANPVQQTGDLLAAITLALLVFAMGGGWLTDRFGAHRVMSVASLLGSAGCFLLALARTPTAVVLFGSVMGAGIGLFLTSNWAMANRLAPVEEAGMFLGLTNLATAGSGALGRLEGPFIDLLNNAYPGTHLGYTALFVFGGVCTLAVIPLLWKTAPAVKTGEAQS